jgi:4-amino-4-deoxy-L-arabinose transferase-like glycosyltransferase
MAADDAKFSGMEAASIGFFIILSLAIIGWRWVGYQGHDDASYAAAALDWVAQFPALGTDHWALRYPLVLPIAGTIALFGFSIAALTVVNLATYFAFLVVSYVAARHWFGRVAASLVTLINIILPQFPVQATYANPDLPEMALVIASFWALMLARQRGGPWGLLLLSGGLAGIGFLTRETSVILVVLYGILFLAWPAMARWKYAIIGAGFVLVLGLQAGYFTARTGDPFYRARISATHDRVDRTAKQTEAVSAGRGLDSEGVLATSPVLAPLVAVFASQKYGLLFYLALPAYLILAFGKRLAPPQRDVLHCAALGALVSYLFVALNSGILYVVPRYFMVTAAFAALPVAVLGTAWLQAGGWRRAGVLLTGAAFVVSSFLLLYLEDTRPMRAEEAIVAFIAGADGPVHIEPETARRLHYLLLVQGLEDRITTEPPGPGSLVAAKDGVVQACLAASGCVLRAQMLPFVPAPGWVEVARQPPPRRLIAGLLGAAGLAERLPQDIRRKIEQPGSTMMIYRVPD